MVMQENVKDLRSINGSPSSSGCGADFKPSSLVI